MVVGGRGSEVGGGVPEGERGCSSVSKFLTASSMSGNFWTLLGSLVFGELMKRSTMTLMKDCFCSTLTSAGAAQACCCTTGGCGGWDTAMLVVLMLLLVSLLALLLVSLLVDDDGDEMPAIVLVIQAALALLLVVKCPPALKSCTKLALVP